MCREVFMQIIRRLITIVVLAGVLTGCASEIAKPVGLDVALRGVEEDMKAASAVSLHDILSRDAIQEDEFKKAILQAQCFYRRPNPLVPVMIKDMTLTLQGTFTGQGKFVVFGVAVPTGGIEQHRESAPTDGDPASQFYFYFVPARCVSSTKSGLREGLA